MWDSGLSHHSSRGGAKPYGAIASANGTSYTDMRTIAGVAVTRSVTATLLTGLPQRRHLRTCRPFRTCDAFDAIGACDAFSHLLTYRICQCYPLIPSVTTCPEEWNAVP